MMPLALSLRLGRWTTQVGRTPWTARALYARGHVRHWKYAAYESAPEFPRVLFRQKWRGHIHLSDGTFFRATQFMW